MWFLYLLLCNNIYHSAMYSASSREPGSPKPANASRCRVTNLRTVKRPAARFDPDLSLVLADGGFLWG